MRLRDDHDLAQAIARLCELDPELIGPLVTAVGTPPLRQTPFGFAGLTRVILAQQVSTASAESTFDRLCRALVPLTPETLLDAEEQALYGCGLTSGKLGSLRALARAVREGRLSFDRIADLSAEAAHAVLVELPGVGPWTADTFLLLGLGHADAWPWGDLALQEAVRLLLDRPTRPTRAELDALAERWRPYRGAAAHLLWAFYMARLPQPRRRPVKA